MASFNLINPFKYSLEILHRVSGLFWPILEQETDSKPINSCVQQNRALFPRKTTHRYLWGSNLGMKEATSLCSRTSGNDGSTTPSFVWRVRRGSLLDFWLLCVVFLGDKDGSKYLKNTGVPRWLDFQRRLESDIEAKEGHIKKWRYRLILIYIFCHSVHFFCLCIFWIIIKGKKKSKDFLFTLYCFVWTDGL